MYSVYFYVKLILLIIFYMYSISLRAGASEINSKAKLVSNFVVDNKTCHFFVACEAQKVSWCSVGQLNYSGRSQGTLPFMIILCRLVL